LILTLPFDNNCGSKYGDPGTNTIAGEITDSGTLLYVDAANDPKAVLSASRTST
jgi:hypothetical protein